MSYNNIYSHISILTLSCLGPLGVVVGGGWSIKELSFNKRTFGVQIVNNYIRA